MLKKILNYYHLIFYYILLLIGLSMASWIIWARFIRMRTIRNIPDALLTEYRFWILLYLCCIYFYIIKNLIISSKSQNIIFQDILKELGNLIFKPLITLDHAIKYNKFVKPYYYKIMLTFTKNSITLHDYRVLYLTFFIKIFPRMILVTFLLVDTFYFNKLEIFYKVILIGLLPFLWRYFIYSCKDIQEHWILDLENKYQAVRIYEKGYEFDDTREDNTEAVFHKKEKSIREYIEIKFENIMYNFIDDNVNYQYESTPYCRDEIYRKFNLDKYKTSKILLTLNDLPF